MEKKGVNYLLLVVLCAAMFLGNKESVHAAGAENIAYGKIGATNDEIIAAAKAARATKLLKLWQLVAPETPASL